MGINVLFLEIQVGMAVLIILLARLGMRKLPRVYSYMLWLVVFVRLLVPVAFESRFALMPSAAESGRWMEEDFGRSDTAAGDSAGSIMNSNAGEAVEAEGMQGNGSAEGAGDDVYADRRTEEESESGYGVSGKQETVGKPEAGRDSETNREAGGMSGVNLSTFEENRNVNGTGTAASITGNYEAGDAAEKDLHTQQLFTEWNTALLLIWAMGTAVILIYNVTALLLVKKQIKGVEHFRDNIYTGSRVKTPFTLGVFSPEIYLPPDMEETEREYIICHEQIHIRRKDYMVKSLALLLTAVHWFNPFVWTAFYFMERDMEMSCDEAVIRKMGEKIKKQYSQSLLNFAKGKCPSAVTPITFGENSVKQRVSNVLAYKTASRRAAIPGTIVLFLLTAMLFTVRSDAQEGGESQRENLQNEEQRRGNLQSGMSQSGNQQNGESSSDRKACSLAVRDAGVTSELLHADLILARRAPESALEYWARAYTDRNGDILSRLAADEENFKQWEKVTQRDGSFAFGDSSPWPWGYDHEIVMSPEDSTAEITFHMRTSVPEIFLVKEKVKITELEGLYYVDHMSTRDDRSIETAQKYEEIYGQGGISGGNSGYGAGEESGSHKESDMDGGGSVHDSGTGYVEMAALYDDSFYRAVLIQLLEGGNPSFYQKFADPVESARELLHLGEGTGDVTEWNMVTAMWLRGVEADLPEWASVMAPDWLTASSAAGVGSRVIVTYTFAKDGSQVEIPMELKEESQGIWGLAGGGIREIYNVVHEPEMIEYDEEGRMRGVYVIELSNYGIYRLGAYSGLICLRAGDVGSEAVAGTYEDKLYIFENPEYAQENSDGEAEAVFVLDLLTGELCQEHLTIPQNYEHVFPETDFGLEGGFVIIYGFGKTYSLPLENRNQILWKQKTFRQMNREDKQAYGVDNREYLLNHPGTLVQLSVREPEQTSAFIDLDGDGISEQVILSADPDKQGQYWGYDSYRLQVGGSVITGDGDRLHNDIWAYSPDGGKIILALYEEGPSGDPCTRLFGYENGELTILGEFGEDIRECRIEDGVINGRERCEVMQTAAVYAGWQIGDSGQLELVPQKMYDFVLLNEVQLLEELPVQNILPPEEEGVYFGIDHFTIAPQTVRFLQTDSTFSWVYAEAEDGSRGWFQMDGHTVKELGKDSGEVFSGLLFAD